MKQTIKQLSQLEHVLHRPSTYIGSISNEKQEEFGLKDNKFQITEREYIPGLLKVFNEAIDNAVDQYITTNGKHSNRITVKMDTSSFECYDNGLGIPNTKMKTLTGENKYQAEVAFCQMLSGANYDNDNVASLGTNGIGIKAASIFSKKTIIKNDDGKKLVTITTKNNLQDISISESTTKHPGVHTKMYPDLEYFKIQEISIVYQDLIKERLLHLSIAYPGIIFRFNGLSLKIKPRDYFEMFNASEYIELNDNVAIAVAPSTSESFEHFSLVNGLVTKSGGTHVNVITEQIVNPIRNKLVRKFKTIKPAHIRDHLRVVVIFRNFMNARYTSQTKEQITNSRLEVVNHIDNIKDIEKLVKKIQKNDDIMLNITELFLLKEQAIQNAELKKLKKGKKKPKSEKFMPPIKDWVNIWIAEGDSASINAATWFDRYINGFYAMFGVPPNAYDMKLAELLKSKKMLDLREIIGIDFSKTHQDDLNFQNIIITTDFDLPGHFITGQLIGLFARFGKNLFEEGRIKRFITPLILVTNKQEKIVTWFYDFEEYQKFEKANKAKKYTYDYKKGLGSWDTEEIQHIIKIDGMDKMLETFTIDDTSEESINNWLNGDNADKRKQMLDGCEFNMMNA